MLARLLRNPFCDTDRHHATVPHMAVERLESRRLLSAGDLDPSFSGDGKVLAEDARVVRTGNDAVVQPDGKVVVLGHRGPGGFRLSSAADVELTRYNPDGSLDAAFGSGGRVQTGLGGHDSGVDIEVDAQGRLVVAASSLTTDGRVNRWALLRYLPSGAPDTSFGTGGRTVLDLGDTVGVSGMGLAPDGKIVVSGGTAASRFTVARFTASGDLDATFSGDGLVTTDFGTDRGADALDVAVMADGRIVAMGDAASATSDPATSRFDVVVARYNVNGTLDTTFDGDGKATAPDTAEWELGRALALYPDGRVVVGGDSDGRHTVWRLTAAGRPDATFGTGGVASRELAPDRQIVVNDVLISPDGKIVTGGWQYMEQSSHDFLVARLNPNGTLDGSFDGDGWNATDFSGAPDTVQAIALAPDGDIVAAGNVEIGVVHYATFGTHGLARYNPNGSLDAAFGNGGKVIGRVDGHWRTVNDVEVQPDRKVLVAGSSQTGTVVDFFLARYNADGTLDRTFGGDGIVLTDFGSGRIDVATNILVQSDGTIVVAGRSGVLPGGGGTFPVNEVALARYNADGTLDNSFSGDGRARAALAAAGQTNDVLDLSAYPGGKLLLSGGFGVARFNADGSLDSSFGGDGTAGPTGVFSAAVVAQGTKALAAHGVYVARYNADGTVDSSFRQTELEPGRETGEPGDEEAYSSISDIELAPDGHVLVMGQVHDHVDEVEKIGLWRLNPDGTLDAAFGIGGRIITAPPRVYDARVVDLEVAPDGRFVVALNGDSDLGDGGRAGVVVRYRPDGQVDTSFGLDGWSYLFGYMGVSAVALDPTGDVVLAGPLTPERPGYGVVRLDGVGDEGSVRLDEHARVLFVKGNLTGDTITLGSTRGRVIIELNGRTYTYVTTRLDHVLVYGRDGNDTIRVGQPVKGLDVRAGAGDDTLRGGPGGEILFGDAGNDHIDGGLGADRMSGGLGRDTLDYRSRTRPVSVNADSFDISGEAGEGDRVFGFEITYGGSGDDAIRLQIPGVAYGGAGNDILHGGYGADALWGQEGNDTLFNSDGADYFRGGSGTDTVSYVADTFGNDRFVVDIDGIADDGATDTGTGRAEGDNVYTDVENLVGGPGDDVLTGSAADNLIEGGGGDDVLNGLAGDDTLIGGEGDDTLNDTQGVNTLDGGPGRDTINGVQEPPTSPTLQAEDARMQGARPSSLNTGYTGTGYADYANASGDWVEWTVNATGWHTLTFRYANGGASDRPLSLSVNGQVAIARLSFAPTGSWSTWSTVRVQVFLSGTSSVRLTSIGFNGPNIDSLTVEPQAG